MLSSGVVTLKDPNHFQPRITFNNKIGQTCKKIAEIIKVKLEDMGLQAEDEPVVPPIDGWAHLNKVSWHQASSIMGGRLATVTTH